MALAMTATVSAVSAQDKVESNISADFVNEYIWRGQDLGNVSIQPSASVAYKGFSIGAWGNVGIDKTDTKEFDLTAAYSVSGFNIGVTDYWFNQNGQDPSNMPNKHTVIVPPGKTITTLLTADELGEWAIHCHLLYHMAAGMMNKLIVANVDSNDVDSKSIVAQPHANDNGVNQHANH